MTTATEKQMKLYAKQQLDKTGLSLDEVDRLATEADGTYTVELTPGELALMHQLVRDRINTAMDRDDLTEHQLSRVAAMGVVLGKLDKHIYIANQSVKRVIQGHLKSD